MSYLPAGINEDTTLGSDAEAMKKYWTPGPGDLCFDVGFGPGHWSLAALLRGAAVVALDPAPAAQDLFLGVLNDHGLACPVVPAALWDRTGALVLVGGNSCADVGGVGSEVIACFTLDDFVGKYFFGTPDFINIDAEGAELRIIRGGKRTLGAWRPKLVIEVHANVFRDELKDELKALGYKDFVDDNEFLVVEGGR